MSESDPDLFADDVFEADVVAAEVVEDEVIEATESSDVEYEEDDYEEDDSDHRRRFLFFQAAPAWLVSTMIHVLILLVLGLLTVANPIKIINVLSASATTADGPEIEEFAIEDAEPNEMEEETEEMVEPVEITEPTDLAEALEVVDVTADLSTMPLEMSDFASEMAPASPQLQTMSVASIKPMGSRSEEMKKKLIREYGGTESSEAAVQEALKWFTRHQMRENGGWTLMHNLVCKNRCGNPCSDPKKRGQQINGATSLALLPFLGAGQTHVQGEFKSVVRRGLLFLASNGKPGKVNGLPVIDYRGRGGNMYDHGLATIVLCEAYAMTGDPQLAVPAQAAVNFIITAQGNDGGWRYAPRDRKGGDTSVVGWQLMALKSAYMGHLVVPPASIQGSMLFLNKVQSQEGAFYGYTEPGENFKKGMTAVGLLCRMYTGWSKDNPAIVKGVQKIASIGPSKNGTDLYYDYYAAQVLRQYGGPEWDNFNVKLRDFLVAKQAADGGAKGSWHLTDKGHFNEAGRLCQTSFATMILEVYYRHMPLYADAASEDDFPL